jgi:hypothetical protein
VVVLPTNEHDNFRWHVFAYNSQTNKVELTTLRASDEGLFDVKDYSVLVPDLRMIPGVIKRELDLEGVNLDVATSLSATQYDLQKKR